MELEFRLRPRDILVGYIAEATGAPIRSVRLWTDERVLHPTPETMERGRGAHRIYPISEVYLAAIANTLAEKGMKVELIRLVVGLARIGFEPASAGVLDNGTPIFVTSRAVRGEGKNYLIFWLSALRSPTAVDENRERAIGDWISDADGPPVLKFNEYPRVPGAVFGAIELTSLFKGLATH